MSSTARLATISRHMAPPSASAFDALPLAAKDPLFGLMAAYKADTHPMKVDLGVGAYRDDNAQPWLLPVVKKVGVQSRHATIQTATGHTKTDFLEMYRPRQS